MAEKTIDVYTDGACSGNPGPGGWGVLIRSSGHEEELSGGEPLTTNNRMELMAAIRALEHFNKHTTLTIHTDSMYLKDGITQWLPKWEANGWKTASKKPVKNQDLWEQLKALTIQHTVHWAWVRGHVGHPENERADLLARNAIVAEVMKATMSAGNG